ncbi:MAG TPA: hypothetical protein VGB37_18010 [Candidatus Lokiarchaeia archaeon]
MPKGIFLIKWDEVLGGTIYLKYPEDLKISEKTVQSIQISHNFTESYIITEEKNWNSASFYNPKKEIVIVLVLEKYDEGNDFLVVLEEFNKELEKDLEEEELKSELKRMFNFSQTVFRTRDEVFTKLSNELADFKMKVFFYERKFNKILESDQLNAKAKILYLLSIRDEVNLDDLSKLTYTNEKYTKEIIDSLVKDNIIGFNNKKNTYFIIF